jgi:hypothetical protein
VKSGLFQKNVAQPLPGTGYAGLQALYNVLGVPELSGLASLSIDPRTIDTPIMLKYSYRVVVELFTKPTPASCNLKVFYDNWMAEDRRLEGPSSTWSVATIVVDRLVAVSQDATLSFVLDCANAGQGGGLLVYLDSISLEYQHVGDCLVGVPPAVSSSASSSIRDATATSSAVLSSSSVPSSTSASSVAFATSTCVSRIRPRILPA